MPRMNTKLSELQIKNAKPKAADYKLYDDGGLRLLVRSSGTKVWQYPFIYGGKANIYTIGKYPEVTTAEARQARDEARKMINRGINPNTLKKEARIKRQYEGENGFEKLANEWFSKQTWAEKHSANIKSRLEKDVHYLIGNKPINQITRQDILHILQKIEARGALDVAKRVNQYITAIFEYGLIKGICENNPAIGLSKTVKSYKVQHRAYLSEKQLPEFLRKLDDYSGRTMIKLALKLLMLTFVRPGELRGAWWNEFDLEKAEWRIPAKRMKMSREHIVPLSKEALKVLEHLKPISGHRPLLFPGIKKPNEPISDVTLTKALIILGYKDIATAHGMRATASTILNENGFKPDVIERQLAHIEQNKVRAAYHHTEYLAERKEMMAWWGAYLQDKSKTGSSQ